MSGKGSKPRPMPNRDQYENNWDAIFGNKKNEVKCGICGNYRETDYPGRDCNEPNCKFRTTVNLSS